MPMGGIAKDWNRPQPRPIGDRLGETLKPKGPLKPRVRAAIQRLEQQTAKLDAMLGKLRERDAGLFQRVVEAMQRHDASESRVLSNELAEIRKVSKMLGGAKMSLEQVKLRLTTIHDLGDAMVAIGPAMGTMKGLKSSLGKFMPEADSELSAMTQTLNGLMMDSLAGDSFTVEAEASNADTERILAEAAAVAEQQVGAKFPSVPGPAGIQSENTSTYE